jgi:hypothetical protein
VVIRKHLSPNVAKLVIFAVATIVTAVHAKPLVPQSGRECRRVDGTEWAIFSESLKGKELVAFASWCSSCREKLMATKASPSHFIFISVFEEPEQSAQAMSRLGLTSPCIYGPDLATRLEIKALPWSKKM